VPPASLKNDSVLNLRLIYFTGDESLQRNNNKQFSWHLWIQLIDFHCYTNSLNNTVLSKGQSHERANFPAAYISVLYHYKHLLTLLTQRK
jgi:hypothetical protein